MPFLCTICCAFVSFKTSSDKHAQHAVTERRAGITMHKVVLFMHIVNEKPVMVLYSYCACIWLI